MIGQKLQPVLQKMWQFHLNMNIEDTLTSRCDVIGDVITTKIILVDDKHTIFLYLLSNWVYIENCEIFKTDEHLRSGELFRHKCHRKYVILTG